MNHQFKKHVAIFTIFFILCNLLFYSMPVFADSASPVSLAEWNYLTAPTTASVNATSGTNMTGAVLTNQMNTIPTYSTTSLSIPGWDNGMDTKYWKLALSTKNCTGLTLSSKMRSSGTGPRDFKIQFSTDSVTWNDIPNSTYSIISTTLTQKFTDLSLPAGAENADNLYLRFIMTSNISSRAGTGTYSATETVASGGTSNINNIVIKGVQNAPPVPTVASVTATPDSGTVPLQTGITLQTATQGASIKYSTNGGISYTNYSSPFVISNFPTTIMTYASANGMTDSETSTFTYTQSRSAGVTAAPDAGIVSVGTKVTLSCTDSNAAIAYSLDNQNFVNYTGPITLTDLPTVIYAKSTRSGYLDSNTSTFSYSATTINYNPYFGQLHSHTNISDGIGEVEDAYKYARDTAKVDFQAITDHSNYFDHSSVSNLGNGSNSLNWKRGHDAADAASTPTFVGIYGCEMTWSGSTGGFGHINTFNTAGFETRENSYFTDPNLGLTRYYQDLAQYPDSISQFNHPGTTFGDFVDFSYYNAAYDSVITLIEVGNGEGAVGSNGYFPSYSYYNRALDKGWHVAPTNNQDNHLGKWGNANTARTVVLAPSLSRANIYDAMKNRRVYATEDQNLRINYTVNNNPMGYIYQSKPQSMDVKVHVNDPDGQNIGTLSVIVNGGQTIKSQQVTGNDYEWDFSLQPQYSYYYIKVVEPDGKIAVTAPVWVSNVEKSGISGTTISSNLPLMGETTTVTTGFYNNESTSLSLTNITYSVNGQVVKVEQNPNISVAAAGVSSYSFPYTLSQLGQYNLEVTAVGMQNGVEKTFTDVLKLNVSDPQRITRIVVDASHANDYVSGYYADNLVNFTKLANQKGIRVDTITNGPITDDMLSGAQALLISAPAKKSGTATKKDKTTITYSPSSFSNAELTAIKHYADNGGNLIVCGLADYQDNSAAGSIYQTSVQMNSLLSTLGVSTRLNDDEAVDNTRNGGVNYRLALNNYNTQSPYTAGIPVGRTYSFYSGCTVNMGPNATWIVKGYDTTTSLDSDNKGDGAPIPAGTMVALASEKLTGGGTAFIAGTVFMSDFEIKAGLDTDATQNSNFNISSNILDSVKKVVPLVPISTVRTAENGKTFAVEGYVTSCSSGANASNAFFDTIYVEDATGGIDIFGISSKAVQVGQLVHVEGTVGDYLGDKELRLSSENDVTLMDYAITQRAAKGMSTMDAMKIANGGWLTSVTGLVTKVDKADDGTIQAVYVKDNQDTSAFGARVFIDGYIGYSDASSTRLESFVQVGKMVTAIGVASTDTNGQRLRVRDRSEIVLAGQNSAPVLLLGSGSSIAGQDATVQMTMNNVYQVAGLKVKISYDAGKLTFKNLSLNSSLNASAFNANTPGEILFNAVNADGVMGPCVDVGTLTFTVKAGVEPCTVPVIIASVEGCDVNTQTIYNLTASNGNVVVRPLPVASNVSFIGETVLSKVLTAAYTYTDANSRPEAGTTFQWYAADHGTGTYTAISGATNKTLTITNELLGKDIQVEVTVKNAEDTGIAVRGDNGRNQVTLLGDVNFDGKVSYVDALLALQSITAKITLDQKQKAAADIDGLDGVCVNDVIQILRADLGLVSIN